MVEFGGCVFEGCVCVKFDLECRGSEDGVCDVEVIFVLGDFGV